MTLTSSTITAENSGSVKLTGLSMSSQQAVSGGAQTSPRLVTATTAGAATWNGSAHDVIDDEVAPRDVGKAMGTSSATLKSWKTDFLNGPNDSKNSDRGRARQTGAPSPWPPRPSPLWMHTPATPRLWLPHSSRPTPVTLRSSSGSTHSARPKDMTRHLACDRQLGRADSLRNLTSAPNLYRRMCGALSVVKNNSLVRAGHNAGDHWRSSKRWVAKPNHHMNASSSRCLSYPLPIASGSMKPPASERSISCKASLWSDSLTKNPEGSGSRGPLGII